MVYESKCEIFESGAVLLVLIEELWDICETLFGANLLTEVSSAILKRCGAAAVATW